MDIRKAQTLVDNHLTKIGYKTIETSPTQAYLHLVEEIGEVARSLLHSETQRSKMNNATTPQELPEEIADVFWQTLKLALYLEVDLEEAFIQKLMKNRMKNPELWVNEPPIESGT